MKRQHFPQRPDSIPGAPRRGTLPTGTAWDRAADAWDDFVESGKDWSRDLVHGPALLRMVGPVRGLAVLDLGCGQGYFSRRLARRGAQVVGVDSSSELIRRARERSRVERRPAEYRCLDARRVTTEFSAASFDRIVSGMALMDLPEPARVLAGARRVLRRSGRLVFGITHPVNDSVVSRWARSDPVDHGPRVLDRYFDEGQNAFRWNMPRLKYPFEVPVWHWTLQRWFAMIRRARFWVHALEEPRPTPAQVRAQPELEGPSRFPFWLLLDCRPLPARGS